MSIRNALWTCMVISAILPAGVSCAQIKVTVSPANQPVDETSPSTMRAFSVLNARLASVVDASACECVTSYSVYQACKAGNSAAGCGQAPSCSVTANIPSLIADGATFIFPPGSQVASVVPLGITMSGNHEVKMIKENALPSASQPIGTVTGGSPAGLIISVGSGHPPPPVVFTDAKPVSAGVMQTLRTSFVQPVYPPTAKAAKMSGVVVMKAVISTDGSISGLQIISRTNPVFIQAAIDAVKQWKYKPYMSNGQPISVMTTVTVMFDIDPPPAKAPNGSISQPFEPIPSIPQ